MSIRFVESVCKCEGKLKVGKKKTRRTQVCDHQKAIQQSKRQNVYRAHRFSFDASTNRLQHAEIKVIESFVRK